MQISVGKPRDNVHKIVAMEALGAGNSPPTIILKLEEPLGKREG